MATHLPRGCRWRILRFVFPAHLLVVSTAVAQEVCSSSGDKCRVEYQRQSLLQRRVERGSSSLSERSEVRWQSGYWDGAEHIAWSGNEDVLFAWSAPVGEINVTASSAIQGAGPLTFLRALGLGDSDGASTFTSALQAARARGHLRLHLIGVNAALEPMMAWDQYLMGPLSPEQARLVAAFNLPVTPFKGMHVSVLYSIYMDGVGGEQLAQRQGPFAEGYEEKALVGLYHEVAPETPDVVLALNPGFAHYPLLFWPTLAHLYQRHVPIVATGYGAYLPRVYQYDKRIELLTPATGQTLRLPQANLVTSRLLPFSYVPGGCDPCLEQKPHLVESFVDLNGRAIVVHNFPDEAANAGEVLFNGGHVEPSTVCSDLNGTVFIAGQVGYGVIHATKNPFAYCDDPAHGNCNSNSIATLLEPAPAGGMLTGLGASLESPPGLLRDTLKRFLPCTPYYRQPTVRSCIESRIQATVVEAGGSLNRMDVQDKSTDAYFATVAAQCTAQPGGR